MNCWLLLKEGSRGVVVAIDSLESAVGVEESDTNRLTVSRTSVNGETAGDAAASLKAGATVALRLVVREYRGAWQPRSLQILKVRTGPLSGAYDGRSGDLLFALITFLDLALHNQLIHAAFPGFAATGRLDRDGRVLRVEGIEAKIAAALECEDGLPSGSIVFYPKANAEEIASFNDTKAHERDIRLEPVEPLEEALWVLGIRVGGWWSGSPWQSLDSYRVMHQPIFFGRDDQVTRLLNNLVQHADAQRPGGLIVAASGSGKSSFAQAGLLARMRLLQRPEHPATEYCVWQPRSLSQYQPGLSGEAALAASIWHNWTTPSANGIDSTAFGGLECQDVPRNLETLALVLGNSLQTKPRRRLVWLIDQCEELFTQRLSAPALAALAGFLTRLQEMQVWILGTLRDEHLARFMELKDERGNAAVSEAFNQRIFYLAPMAEAALGQVITQPARVAGLAFGQRPSDRMPLDEILRSDALGADSMPLLGYALHMLYERRQTPREDDLDGMRTPVLTWEAYEGLGRIAGAINKVANRVVAGTSREAQEQLSRLLAALSIPDESGKELARSVDLVEWPKGSPGRQLIDALVEHRLLVRGASDRGAQVRVVHEKLFMHWEVAHKQLEDSRLTRLQIRRLQEKQRVWSDHKEQADELLTSARDMQIAAEVYESIVSRTEYTELTRYVDLSRQRERLLAKQKRGVTWFIGGGLGALGAVMSLAWQSSPTMETRISIITIAIMGAVFWVFTQRRSGMGLAMLFEGYQAATVPSTGRPRNAALGVLFLLGSFLLHSINVLVFDGPWKIEALSLGLLAPIVVAVWFGKNWARLIVLVAIAMGWLVTCINQSTVETQPTMASLISLFQFFAELASYCCLASPTSNAWFRRRSGEAQSKWVSLPLCEGIA